MNSLKKYLTIFGSKKELKNDQEKLLNDEFEFFSINYNLWYHQTIFTEENKQDKPFDYDEKLFNFLNEQEENLINFIELNKYNLKGFIYFDFKLFWKENYYKLSSKQLNKDLKILMELIKNSL